MEPADVQLFKEHIEDLILKSHSSLHSDLRGDLMSLKKDLQKMQVDVTEAKTFGLQAKQFLEDAKPALDTFNAIRGTSKVLSVVFVSLAAIAGGLVGWDEIVKHIK
jgi:hypothetical protein